MNSLLTVRNIVIALIILIVVALVAGGSYTVNDRERGVLLSNGKQSGIIQPGWNLKRPVIDKVVLISTQNQSLVFQKLTAYSADKQTAELRVSVSYHVPPTEVGQLYSQYTSLEGIEAKLIARKVPAEVETVFGQYSAPKVIENRGKFGLDVAAAIKKSVEGGPLVIDSVQVENIDFDDTYEASIREQMKKSVEISTQQNETLKQVEINTQAVNAAKAKADSQLAVATAAAQAIRLTGDAEAYAIKQKADALAANQNLIELTKAQAWNGALPTHMVPGNAVPFLNVK